MSEKKLKHPSSARRNIKLETFSSFVSGARLRHVQSLLSESSESRSPDSLLIVLGIDGRYNEGMAELANFLLFDFFSSRKAELESSGYDEEIIDDMVFVVRRDSVDVYCNPINYHYLLPYIAHWKNLTIHCLTDTQYEDEERAEEFKVHSFIAMISQCNKIGVPFFRTGNHGEFDKMGLEKWPLIQAYALEDYGGHGFFTMRHEVMDMGDYLHSLYHILDPVSLETLITQHVPLFERQWTTMIANVDIQKDQEKKTFTEHSVSEPLRSFFTHGRVTGHISNVPGPFVLFGTNSSCKKLTSGQIDSSLATIYTTGVAEQPAIHMVCEAVSSRTPLRCTRTYFFYTGVHPHPLSLDEDSSVVSKKSDIRLLVSLYKACIIAVLESIRVYSNTLDPEQAEEECRSVLLEQCEEDGVEIRPGWLSKTSNVRFSLQAFDNCNRALGLRAGKSVSLGKTACMSLMDIPSIEHPGQTLGSVIFGESFLESTIYTIHNSGEQEINGNFVLLTRNVPYFTTWPMLGLESKKATAMETILQKPSADLMGKKLAIGDNTQLHVDGGSPMDCVLDGHVYFYEDGVIFSQSHLGSLVLPKSALVSIQFYDGDTSSAVILIIMTYKDHFVDFIPFQMRTPQQRIILPVLPKTRCHKELYSQILPLWRQKERQPEVEMLKKLPDDLTSLHQQLQYENDITSRPLGGAKPLKKAATRFPGLSDFIRHFTACSVGQQFVPQRHLEAVLNQEYDEGGFKDDSKLILTLLGGVPGSYQDNLCQSLANSISDQSDWAVIQHGLEQPQTFNTAEFEQSVKSVWDKLSKDATGHDTHALVLLPGNTDIVHVVHCLTSNKQLAKHTNIGAVTVCIDSDNCFQSDNTCLPGLLTQCAQGWVNNIVYTAPSVKTSLTPHQEKIQDLLKAVNNDVAFLLAPEGHMTRSTDIDKILSDSSFNTGPLLQARYLSIPGWHMPVSPMIVGLGGLVNEVKLNFNQPLDKSRLLTRLKGLLGCHTGPPYTGNIYHVRGRFTLTDSNTLQELQYTVISGHLSLTRASVASETNLEQPYFVAFMGYNLQDQKLKDWLQGCAQKEPERKVRRTLSSLTKADVNKITKEHHLDPLPEGWFYNGSQYVSMAGDKSNTHPDTEMHLANYLEKTNKEVDKHNHYLDTHPYNHLFD